MSTVKKALERDLTVTVGATPQLAWRAVTDQNLSGVADVANKHTKAVEEWRSFGRETFAKVFAPDNTRALPADKVTSSWAPKAHDALARQPRFDELTRASKAHRSVAAMATAALCDELGKAMKLDELSKDDATTTPQSLKDAIERMKLRADDLATTDPKAANEQLEGAKALAQQLAQAEGRRASMVNKLAIAESNGTLARIIKGAAGAAERGERAVSCLRGWSLTGSGASGAEALPDALVRFVLDNPLVEKILLECGRALDSLAAKSKAEVTNGSTELVGISQGSDVMRLTPSEMARLGRPDLRLGLYADLSEGTAQQWEMLDEKPQDDGDKLVILDASGSMEGARVIWARAIAAAAVLSAKRAMRRAVFCVFAGTGTARVAVLHPDGSGLAAVIELLGFSAGGGTDVVDAIRVAAAAAGGLRNPDTLLVTDGVFPNLDNASAALAKQGGRRFVVAVLGSSGNAGIKGADHTWHLNDSHLNAEAAAKVLSTVAP